MNRPTLEDQLRLRKKDEKRIAKFFQPVGNPDRWLMIHARFVWRILRWNWFNIWTEERGFWVYLKHGFREWGEPGLSKKKESKMSLLREDNNMGNMTKAEALQFFEECRAELDTDCTIRIGKVGGSFYNDLNKAVCLDERDLNGFKWQVKDTILHELAHHFVPDNAESCKHGVRFYREYLSLIGRFMAGQLDHKEALEDMVWQFAHRGVKNGKSVMHTGGLSALESAFEALSWDDPKYFEDMDGVICDVEGCVDWVSNQGCNWSESGYWCLCSEHGFSKKEQPAMKQRAIDREAKRGKDGRVPIERG